MGIHVLLSGLSGDIRKVVVGQWNSDRPCVMVATRLVQRCMPGPHLAELMSDVSQHGHIGVEWGSHVVCVLLVKAF